MPLNILTANRLKDGCPLWYKQDGSWSRNINEAMVADTAQMLALLKEYGQKALHENQIIDPTLVEVENRNGTLYALRLRERIRAEGPSIFPFRPVVS